MEESSFKNRREKLAELLPNTAVLVSAATHITKSHDTDFPFHQNTNFKYLTGFREPNAMLVMTQKPDEGLRSHLFVQAKDPHMEMWHGRRLGVEHTKEVFDFDYIYEIDEAWNKIPELLWGHKQVAVDWNDQPTVRDRIIKVMSDLAQMRKKKQHRPQILCDLAPWIGRLRLVKEANEILFMREAAHIAGIGHKAAMAIAAPNKNEADVRHFMEYIFRKNGSEDNAYDSIVAGGKNALILHYVENNHQLHDGDLLLIDAGAAKNGYASDITRTFPINGKFSGAQKEVYEIVLSSQKLAISLVKPGATIVQIHQEVEKSLARDLLDADLLSWKGDLSKEAVFEKLVSPEAGHILKTYYPHGTSHWLGLDVHDQSPYLESDLSDIKLDQGMVITVEPGLYFNKPHDEIGFKAIIQDIGVRIEDDVMTTDKGHDNLTAATPKEVAEIEEACRRSQEDFL